MDQSCFLGAVQAVKTRKIEGIRIFSIVVGLGFLNGRCHGCGRLRLVVPGQRWLHRPRRLKEL